MKLHLGYLLGFTALLLAICGAFFSVFGLSHMFAGAYLSVVIMASTLEFSKLVIATYLHNYWTQMNKFIRLYLTSGVVILALITSLGIYGYLSNAYQITANKLELFNGDVGLVTSKIIQFENKIKTNESLLESKNSRLNQLMDIRNKQEDRIITNNSRTNRGQATQTDSQITLLNKEIDEIHANTSALNDSITKYNTTILTKKSDSDISGEVTTLQYMSDISGLSMGQVANIFILLIVFVFDPLAICLVIATNSVFAIHRSKKNTVGVVDMDVVDVDVKLDEPINTNSEIIDDKVLEVESTPSVLEEMKHIEPSNQDLEIQSKLEQAVNKIRYEDIKEIKNRKQQNEANRGFSKPIPKRQTND